MDSTTTRSGERTSILLVIPCFNEEDNIRTIIQHLSGVKARMDHRQDVKLDILVINDGSTDATREVLEQACSEFMDCWTIHSHSNKGYGHVLRTGFALALDECFDWVITFDMDGQHEPTCLYKFIDAIARGTSTSMISGSRYLDPALFWQNPWKDRFLVNAIVASVFNAVMETMITDAFCGMKAHDVHRVNELGLSRDGYEMPVEMLCKTIMAGQIIDELPVPVIYKSRDEVIKKSSPGSLLFKKGEERVSRYLKLIEQLRGEPLRAPLQDHVAIFEKFFTEMDEITRDNFAATQQRVFSAVRELEHPS